MTREDFILNYIKAEDVVVRENEEIQPHAKITLALIGSIHDLQEQIAQLNNKLEQKDK